MECAAISSLQRQIAEWALALVLAWLCASARAQSPDPTKAGGPTQGVNASATYDGETASDLSGGAKRGSTYHGSLQVQAAFDFERLFGWADTTAFLYGMGLHGGQPDEFTGGAQGVSSITGPRARGSTKRGSSTIFSGTASRCSAAATT
jgi:porin